MVEKLAVGDPDHVPVGIYAKESLEYLGCMGCGGESGNGTH